MNQHLRYSALCVLLLLLVRSGHAAPAPQPDRLIVSATASEYGSGYFVKLTCNQDWDYIASMFRDKTGKLLVSSLAKIGGGQFSEGQVFNDDYPEYKNTRCRTFLFAGVRNGKISISFCSFNPAIRPADKDVWDVQNNFAMVSPTNYALQLSTTDPISRFKVIPPSKQDRLRSLVVNNQEFVESAPYLRPNFGKIVQSQSQLSYSYNSQTYRIGFILLLAQDKPYFALYDAPVVLKLDRDTWRITPYYFDVGTVIARFEGSAIQAVGKQLQ